MTSVLEPQVVDGVDPRIQARRDEVARARNLRRRRWRLAILVVLIVFGGAWLCTRTSLLDVDHIDIRGATHTPVDDVRSTAGVEPGDQLLDVDTGEIRDRLRGLPWVADAEVGLSWRGRLVVEVRERVPVATLPDAEGRMMLVDRDGRVLADAASTDPPVAPDPVITLGGMVAGSPPEVLPEPAGDALTVVTALTPGLRSRVESLTITPDRRIELGVLPSGRVSFCGATNVEEKIRTLQTVFAQVDDRSIATIDVCVPDQATVTRAP